MRHEEGGGPQGDALLVGRQRELTQLTRALDRTCAGVGGVVVIAGEPGIGKTSLVAALASQASDRGMAVAWGHCVQGGGAPPFWPWTHVVRHTQALADRDGPVDDLVALLEAPPVDGAPSGAEPRDPHARLRLFDRVVTHLRRVAHDRPLLVVLEDVHAADPSSLQLLGHAADRVMSSRLLVAVTVRDPPGLPDQAPPTGRSTRRLVLGGLDERDVGALTEVLSGILPPAPVAEAIHRSTGGNPYFVDCVVRLLAVDDAITAPSAIAVPEELRTVLRERIAALAPDTVRILELAAVMGERFALPALGLVAHRPVEALDEALAASAATGVVVRDDGGYRFRHGLVREVLYEDLPSVDRATMHLRVGEVLAGLVRDDESDCHAAVLAHHFLEALPHGDPGEAVHHARRAARSAYVAHAYEDAAALYARALPLVAGDERARLELLLALGHAQWRAGQARLARRTFLEAAASARAAGDGQQLALAALGAGGGRVEHGSVDHELIALLEEALEQLGDGPLRGRVLGRLAVALYFTPELARRDALSAQAVRLADDGPAMTAAALAARHFAVWGPDTLDERLRIAERIVELGRRTGGVELALEGRTWMVVDLLESGDIAGAEAEIDAFTRRAAQVGLPLYDWYAALFNAARTLWRGPTEEAEEAAGRALEAGQRAGVASADQFYGVQLYVLRLQQSRLPELEQPVRTLLDAYPDYEVWTCALARLLVDAGRHAEARRLAERLAADGFARLPRDVNWLVSLALLAEVTAAVGSVDHAEQLHGLLAPFADRLVVVASAVACLGPVSYYLGLLCAVTGRHEAAEDHFRHALAAAAAHAPAWTERIARRRAALREPVAVR